MIQIDAQEITHNFMKYLQIVERGKKILILRHGQPIAQLLRAFPPKKSALKRKSAQKKSNAGTKT